VAPSAGAVNDGRRPPPPAARSVIDRGEHGDNLSEVGLAKLKSRRCSVVRINSSSVSRRPAGVMVLSEVDTRSPHHGSRGAVTPQCKRRTARRWSRRRTTLDTRSSLPAVPARTASPLARSSVVDGQATAAPFVHRKSVPSIQIRCRMTASLRATATLAFVAPTFFISRTPHAFSGDQRSTLVSNTPAAS